MDRLKILLKARGMTQTELASKLSISPGSLVDRTNNPTLKSMIEISDKLDCHIHELFSEPEGYLHSYEKETNEWLGIRKK